MRMRLLVTIVAALLTAACVSDSEKSVYRPPNLDEAARLNTELGAEYARQGRFDIALEKLKKAVDQNDRYAPAHTTLAYVYTQRGDFQLAEQEYRRALDLDDKNPELNNNFGAFLCGQGKTAEADRYFMTALKDHSYATPESAWVNAGLCAQRARDTARAEDDFRQALKLNPESAEALAQLADITYRNGDAARAQAFLQRYERVGRPRPDMLLLSVAINRGLGDIPAARRSEAALLRNFPESGEAAQLQKSPASP